MRNCNHEAIIASGVCSGQVQFGHEACRRGNHLCTNTTQDLKLLPPTATGDNPSLPLVPRPHWLCVVLAVFVLLLMLAMVRGGCFCIVLGVGVCGLAVVDVGLGVATASVDDPRPCAPRNATPLQQKSPQRRDCLTRCQPQCLHHRRKLSAV